MSLAEGYGGRKSPHNLGVGLRLRSVSVGMKLKTLQNLSPSAVAVPCHVESKRRLIGREPRERILDGKHCLRD